MSAVYLVLLGVFATALMAFFAWLATGIVDIRGRIVGIERDIASLLGTRSEQKAEKVAGTDKRLTELERRK